MVLLTSEVNIAILYIQKSFMQENIAFLRADTIFTLKISTNKTKNS